MEEEFPCADLLVSREIENSKRHCKSKQGGTSRLALKKS